MYGETLIILVIGPLVLLAVIGVIQGVLAANVKNSAASIGPLLPLPILAGAATAATIIGACTSFGFDIIGWGILFLWAVGALLGALLGTILGTLAGARSACKRRKRKDL